MKPWLAAIPIALSASAASAAFHPVEDRPYRYETVETRTADGVVRRFHASRTLVFHRTASGYDAVVTLDAIDHQADGAVGRMFAAATGALLHYPLRYRLDATGAVIDVADADAILARIADRVERALAGGTARGGESKALANPLRATSPERTLALFRSILSPVVAGAAADRPPGQTAVTVPSRPPLPRDTELTGIETVSRGVSGIVTIDVRAGGGIDVATPSAALGARIATPAPSPTATLHLVRNIDPLSGLVRDSRETSDATLTDGDALHTTRIETVITVTLVRE